MYSQNNLSNITTKQRLTIGFVIVALFMGWLTYASYHALTTKAPANTSQTPERFGGDSGFAPGVSNLSSLLTYGMSQDQVYKVRDSLISFSVNTYEGETNTAMNIQTDTIKTTHDRTTGTTAFDFTVVAQHNNDTYMVHCDFVGIDDVTVVIRRDNTTVFDSSAPE